MRYALYHVMVSVSVLSPLTSSSPLVAVEGSSGTMQDQTSNNAIPRIGRRASNSVAELIPPGKDKRVVPPMFSIPTNLKFEKRIGGLPPIFSIPQTFSIPTNLKLDKRVSEIPDKRAPEESGPAADKRSPWTSSWANLMYKPGSLSKPKPGKRSALPNDWDPSWGNLLRNRQGFRLHDGGHDYLDNTVMYKRGKDPLMGNNVPLMGKRSPSVADNTVEEDKNDDADNPWDNYLTSGQDLPGLMSGAALDHPHPGTATNNSWLRIMNRLQQAGLPQPGHRRNRDWNVWLYNILNSG